MTCRDQTRRFQLGELKIMLELGKKYDFGTLRKSAAGILRQDWPVDLSGGWDARRAWSRIDPSPHIVDDASSLKAAAILAWEEEVHVVLPVILAQLLGKCELVRLVRIRGLRTPTHLLPRTHSWTMPTCLPH